MVRFLISVDLEKIDAGEQRGLDLKTISYLDGILVTVTPSTVEEVKLFLHKYFHLFAIYVDATAFREPQEIVNLLNLGVTKIFLSLESLKGILINGLVEDSSRLVLSSQTHDHNHNAEAVEIMGQLKELNESASLGGICIREGSPSLMDDNFRAESLSKSSLAQYVLYGGLDWKDFKNAMDRGQIPILPATQFTNDPAKDPHLIPVSWLLTSIITSDRPDGLFTTLVVNEYSQCLGLVYSNEESIVASLKLGKGVYKSRKRPGLWIKGETSGDSQELIRISLDCDADALQFHVRQGGSGFCHLKTATCFGPLTGLTRLESTLKARKTAAPPGSYTARLFSDPKLLQAKIMEEAKELCEAQSPEEVAAEAADLFYFALTRCIAAGVRLEDVERDLDLKSMKVSRRKGDAKPEWVTKFGVQNSATPLLSMNGTKPHEDKSELVKEAASVPKSKDDPAGLKNGLIQMKRYNTSETDAATLEEALRRPSQRSPDAIMGIVRPIIEKVRSGGDAAVLEYTHKFEKAISLQTPVLHAPFPSELMQLSQETIEAIDISFENIRRFHAAQQEKEPLRVETMPGIVCSRFARPIERVGLYVPGGTAVLPSTALMLGVPAMVAGCKTIVMASPPRSDGTLTPEVVYIAHRVGAESIVLAGGAQAVAAMAYGTQSVPKVDKILGPGNQFVTAAKMHVANDTNAGVSIDMPAGPSEVLVIADHTANAAFVASDLLSQAEHGSDSQVVLIAVDLDEAQIRAIEDELHAQASALPRVDIVRAAIAHSVTLVVRDIDEAMNLSNAYAPEHLILQVEDAEALLPMVQNAGSVFIGQWTPESVGDYSAGVNHSLPTYGYAKQYSGVNLGSFMKHITSSHLTPQGLKNVGPAVMQLAHVEQLEAHRRAVSIRLEYMERST